MTFEEFIYFRGFRGMTGAHEITVTSDWLKGFWLAAQEEKKKEMDELNDLIVDAFDVTVRRGSIEDE